MSSHYLDTSALVKQYRIEQGTPRVQTLFEDKESPLYISELALVEAASAFQRLKRRGEITEEAMKDALEKFDNDALTRLNIIDVKHELIEQAKSLVLQHDLRTLDALQLATALSLKDQPPVFVAADDRLLEAAQPNGLSILNPTLMP
jgi:predicted nucleic acid-binding protein